ncbi:MAG: tRNA 2-thiouridine(34) synthase MnmA [Candidatus Dasytiphilus stammeri]
MSMKNKKVIIGMSGGVDSSVVAFLLKKQQYHVEGVFMKNWEEDDKDNYCHAAQDLADAQAVCDKLNISLHKINFSTEYWDNVFQNFLEDYKSGRTPNPDILCNKEIKFNTFMNFAIEDLGADFIATGHYVRKKKVNGHKYILRGVDQTKDQSYFLYTLTSQQLKYTIFPLGSLTKNTVRKIALQNNLVTANKKDSTGICFIGKKNFRNFLRYYLPDNPGDIFTFDGKKIGHHKGIMFHTIGQRKGLGIGGIKDGTQDPWYVVDKDVKNNILIVAQGRFHSQLMSTGMICESVHFVNKNKLNKIIRCTVKTRYRQPDIPCTLIWNKDRTTIKVIFDNRISAITPGQSAVFYTGDICLGGGIIKNRLPETIKLSTLRK